MATKKLKDVITPLLNAYTLTSQQTSSVFERMYTTPNSLPDNDLNNITQGGIYQGYNDGLINFPPGIGELSFLLEVFHPSGWTVFQRLCTSTGSILVRGYSASTWSNWKEL